MRLVGFLLFALSVLGGFTVWGGYLEAGLVSGVVYLVLALFAAYVLKSRFGSTGVICGLVAALVLSLLWPIALVPFYADEACEPGECKEGVFLATEAVEQQ